MDRAQVVLGHLHRPAEQHALDVDPTAASVLSRHADGEDDVVICAALRTPVCRARRGLLKDALPDDLLETVFKAILHQTSLEPTLIGDICIGNVLQAGSGANTGRIAQFLSGIPETVPLTTVNRQCSSGLQAIANIAAGIKAGYFDIGLAAGVESMSMFDMHKLPEGFVVNPKISDCPKAQDILVPMGITSENVASRYGVSREKQDTMAVASHQKAAAAQESGHFREEIVPVQTVFASKDGEDKQITVTDDDGIRKGTTIQVLSRLRPAFAENGTTTAGNSSQTSDGAAAVLLARRSAARRHQLPVLGILRSFAVVGVPPDVMGIGPAYAIPAALAKAGLTIEDIDIFEINEAFASQATYCVEKLSIPMSKVNPLGGAIALGHPLGCTGARQTATLLHELKRRGKRSYGVVSMCIGTGMGAAAVYEYPG